MALDSSYDTKTLDEIQAEFVSTGVDLAAMANHRQELSALIDQRKAQAKAQARVDALDPIEREALKQALESRAQQTP